LRNEGEILSALADLEQYAIPLIALTRGVDGAIVKVDKDFYRLEAIPVRVVNAGGCGDAFLSAILAGLARGQDDEEMLQWAAGVAAAAAEMEATVGFDLQRAEELARRAVVTRISAS
jgi:fructose-1-phosphate kinase PfkB-like protein